MSSNAITDNNFGIDLPETEVNSQSLVEERKAAKFSKTREYQELKKHLESRIEFYQSFLPSGEPVMSSDITKLGTNWAVANAIIAEFNSVLTAYENASEVVKEADKNAR